MFSGQILVDIYAQKFVTFSLLICIFSINRLGKVCGRNFLLEKVWNNDSLLLLTSKDNLLDLNHTETLLSSTCNTWASLITTISISLTLLQMFYILKSEEVVTWQKKKIFFEYVYLTCVISSSIPNEIKQSYATKVKTFTQNVFHWNTLTLIP